MLFFWNCQLPTTNSFRSLNSRISLGNQSRPFCKCNENWVHLLTEASFPFILLCITVFSFHCTTNFIATIFQPVEVLHIILEASSTSLPPSFSTVLTPLLAASTFLTSIFILRFLFFFQFEEGKWYRSRSKMSTSALLLLPRQLSVLHSSLCTWGFYSLVWLWRSSSFRCFFWGEISVVGSHAIWPQP